MAMTYTLATINPFFAARYYAQGPAAPRSRPVPAAPPTSPRPDDIVYARLPRAPKNASPVPHLTSLYHFHRAGEYGDRSYPGYR
jgi:hypothetical protein